MATTTFTFTVSTSPSTSVTVTPTPGMVAPVAVGAVLGTLAILPSSWMGGVSLSGTDAAKMRVGGAAPNYRIEAAQQLGGGTYSATVTVTP